MAFLVNGVWKMKHHNFEKDSKHDMTGGVRAIMV